MITGAFMLIWLAIFYGIVYVAHRFVPKGLFISQIIFIYIWILLPMFFIDYVGGALLVKEMPIFWIIATLMLLIKIVVEKKPH